MSHGCVTCPKCQSGCSLCNRCNCTLTELFENKRDYVLSLKHSMLNLLDVHSPEQVFNVQGDFDYISFIRLENGYIGIMSSEHGFMSRISPDTWNLVKDFLEQKDYKDYNDSNKDLAIT